MARQLLTGLGQSRSRRHLLLLRSLHRMPQHPLDPASVDLSVDNVEGIIEAVPRAIDGKRKWWHFVTLLWE